MSTVGGQGKDAFPDGVRVLSGQLQGASSGFMIPVLVHFGRISTFGFVPEDDLIAAAEPVSHWHGGFIAGNVSCTTCSFMQASRLM